MQPEHEKIREIFLEASEMASEEDRHAFLTKASGTDEELRRKVEQMIEMQTKAGEFFKPLPAASAETAATEVDRSASNPELVEGPGTLIGRYKLLEKIGEGGFGIVYMAEQFEPVKRKVALKIIKLGMDTREVIARFDAERQALALMDHPNVARVLDAGATGSGRPFFVMELVRGLPVTEFCDRECLSPRERIELFIAVCHAAQHAHSKGIIHRDLKPSNILVTMQDGRPVPKVIDFGIAKAIQKPLTERTLFTRFGQMIGTPVYMSPEQTEFSAVDVDTRSDVYSLGVVLYELLTSKQPFDLQRLLQAGHYEMMRIIREEDPPRPSTRLTRLGKELETVAERRHVNPKRLGEQVKGDLDCITMKALQKDRSRRYETAAALAEDLVRHLEHRPVRAGPPSMTYRSLKFVQRHRYAVATFAWIVLALMVGLATAVYGFLDARAERERAVAAEHTADQQRQFALIEAKRAQAKELRARQISYASDMALASQALELGNLGRALSLLNRHGGAEPGEDLRGWEWRYLWQQCQSAELFQLAALSNSVLCLSVSDDGRIVAASDFHGRIAVWSLPGRSLMWSSNASPVMALSGDGEILVDGEGMVRDAESGIVLRKLPGVPYRDMIKRFAFSPDGKLLAGLIKADELALWDAQSWTLLATHKGFPCGGTHFGGMAFLLGGERIAVGLQNAMIRLIETRSGRLVREWKAHSESVTCVAASPDGRLLASASGYAEDQVKLWNAEDGQPAGVLNGHRAWVRSLVFAGSPALLVSAGADQSICVWELSRKELVVRLKGHAQEVWNIACSVDGKTLVSASKDGSIKVWPALELPGPLGKPAALASDSSPGTASQPAAPAHVQSPGMHFSEGLSTGIAFSPDGREILAADAEGWVGRWALPSLRPLGRVESLGPGNYVVACSSKLGLLAAVNKEGALRIWDYEQQLLRAATDLCAEKQRVTALDFAPAAGRLVAVVDMVEVHALDANSGKQVATWRCPAETLNQPSLSPDGLYLANGGKELVVYSVTNGLPVFRIAAHKPSTDVMAFSPDGKLLATASQEGLAKLWSTGKWQELGTLRGHLLGVHSVAFSTDGRRLATGSLGNEAVKVWDLATMQEVLNLKGPGDVTWRIGFSPDERTLVAASAMGSLRCWSAPAQGDLP